MQICPEVIWVNEQDELEVLNERPREGLRGRVEEAMRAAVHGSGGDRGLKTGLDPPPDPDPVPTGKGEGQLTF
jgi:hypothetical protein